MANEFDYSAALSITHPSIDPTFLSRTITELRPTIETMAGTPRVSRKGELIVPARTALLSHWLAELHDARTLDSNVIPLSQFVKEQLMRIERHRDLFLSLRDAGRVTICIDIFPKSNCAEAEIEPDTLAGCANLGLAIELGIYFRDRDGPT